MSMHLVFRDLDKVHVIQHLRLQGDGNDGDCNNSDKDAWDGNDGDADDG